MQLVKKKEGRCSKKGFNWGYVNEDTIPGGAEGYKWGKAHL